MQLQLKEHVKDLNKGINGFTQIAMQLKHISADNLRADITAAVCDRAFIGDDDLPRSEKAFKEQIKRARSRLPAVKEGLARHLTEAAQEYIHLTNKMNRHPLAAFYKASSNTLSTQALLPKPHGNNGHASPFTSKPCNCA